MRLISTLFLCLLGQDHHGAAMRPLGTVPVLTFTLNSAKQAFEKLMKTCGK
jgi:hypothetical protein